MASSESGRLNLNLPPELNTQLNDYMFKWAKKKGKLPPQGLKTAIGRAALSEWLEKHGKDFNINFNTT
jgi:hypothetical protein